MKVNHSDWTREELMELSTLPKVSDRIFIGIGESRTYDELVSANASIIKHFNDGKDLVVDDNNKDALIKIAKWFAMKDPDIDPLKGLLIRGEKGTGKTNLTYALSLLYKRYYKQEIGFITARGLADLFRREDQTEIMKIRNRAILIIDDLGTEEYEVRCYGTILNPFLDIFETRYNLRKLTIITTNLPLTQNNGISGIHELYGDRILDRMKETMNDIVLKGKSRR